ncbi:MAG: hypothetical protein KJ597_07265, partial [Nanoarchaeota archaeon]|nr:hypothetical protein [Nanoarchaeota archaeon]
CDDLGRNPFSDPNIDVSCRYDKFTVKELVCNNGLDDDNDNKIDIEDEDCNDNLLINNLGKDENYEIVIKSSDPFGITVIAK